MKKLKSSRRKAFAQDPDGPVSRKLPADPTPFVNLGGLTRSAFTPLSYQAGGIHN